MKKFTGSNYRRHRFQPLGTLQAHERGQPEPFQQGYDEGLQQGQERGFEQGLEEGRRQGEREGFDAGYREGLSQGEARGQAAFLEAMAPLQALQRALEEQRKQDLSEHVEHLCALVEQVARRVVHAELSLNPGQLAKLVEDALARMDTRAGDLVVFVCPEDHQRLAQVGTSEIGGYPIRADEELSVGDCRIESEHQQQTIRSEERLQACVEQVRDELSEAGEGER